MYLFYKNSWHIVFPKIILIYEDYEEIMLIYEDNEDYYEDYEDYLNYILIVIYED